MQFLLQMCYAPTVCHDTLPVALRLSYECSSVLITDLLRSSRYKAIPHGSTALTDILPPLSHISHRWDILCSPGGVHSVGITTITIIQIDFAKPLWLSLVPRRPRVCRPGAGWSWKLRSGVRLIDRVVSGPSRTKQTLWLLSLKL